MSRSLSSFSIALNVALLCSACGVQAPIWGGYPNAVESRVRDTAADKEEAASESGDSVETDAVAESRVEPTDGDGGPLSKTHPLAAVSDAELERMFLENKAALGPVSLGQPDGGQLWNGVKMTDSERWRLVDPPRAWATPETIGYLEAAIAKVHEQFPKTRKLYIGDISREQGGRFGQHLSHQSGRDVDLGFYCKERFVRWYTEGTEENLDLPRTWALVRAFVTETDVELILLDRELQWLLRSYARQIGEDRAWLRSLFVKRSPPHESPLIQHAPGHKSHIHVRFYNPVAQETGWRVYPIAVKQGLFKAHHHYVRAWSKRGESRDHFIKRIRTSLASLQKANGARALRFRSGSFYKILRYGPVDPGEGPVVVPPRMLPPEE